jgi:hypothetical protein
MTTQYDTTTPICSLDNPSSRLRILIDGNIFLLAHISMQPTPIIVRSLRACIDPYGAHAKTRLGTRCHAVVHRVGSMVGQVESVVRQATLSRKVNLGRWIRVCGAIGTGTRRHAGQGRGRPVGRCACRLR